jgi:hypothetical protein
MLYIVKSQQKFKKLLLLLFSVIIRLTTNKGTLLCYKINIHTNT